MNIPVLSIITFLPLACALLLIFLPKEKTSLLKTLVLVITVINFIISLTLFFNFDGGTSDPQFVEKAEWIGYGIHYHLGIDGISLFLVLLTTFLMPLVILSSWTYIRERVKEYLIFMLILQTGMIGVFVSLNLFLFYIFWEAMLIPMYFLIGIWGGKRKIYATVKYVIFTMFGSLLMLVALFFMYNLYYKATGTYSFNLFDFQNMILNPNIQIWLFLAFALAFAIKVPMFPFHTWLPDAHVEAPTGGSVVLAAVLLKMGTYGFLRFAMPMFPDALMKLLPYLSILALIGIIYGGLMALIQKDIKSLVAYSSVSHMGLIMLAVFALNFEGLQGALYQMLNHGLSTGALFICVGILYERSHTRLIKDYGGVSKQMPVFAAIFLICILSSVGLPGLNGFVGEILCLFGIFQANQMFAILAVTTVILAAAYLLWMFQRVMHGPITNDKILKFPDLSAREIIQFVPIIVMMFWMGIYPQTFLRKMDASVTHLLDTIKKKEVIFARSQMAPDTVLPQLLLPPDVPEILEEEEAIIR
ncbi:MAG: NADH-quinone oxidoreductase subunit M [Acidobacteria bacterium]|nr:NADH-quinone oxidoreductase subunit M [Acidobacteriota bacterium]MBU4329489.1 NADH-quinone oxidoreductase subunit M [Acidobacteriota bacterium]MBU4495112.1 NADH-quinone oxidoreductase subunit M [Acidobacteriota bacterium]MCG2814700.1 NADH-quinone oxidoreductase subunit M [Candidatus Aminicenantes bacterium]